MSATRTFTVVKSSAVVTGDAWTFTRGENTRQDLDLLAYCGLTFDCGGSQDVSVVTGAATWQPVRAYRDITLNGDSLGGMTIEAVVYYQTSNAGQAVQVRIRNTTDSSTAATGTSSTSTSVVKETLTVTLASGAKVYRLELLGGASLGVFAWGYIRAYKTPA